MPPAPFPPMAALKSYMIANRTVSINGRLSARNNEAQDENRRRVCLGVVGGYIRKLSLYLCAAIMT
jgi:hypothetical protein